MAPPHTVDETSLSVQTDLVVVRIGIRPVSRKVSVRSLPERLASTNVLPFQVWR